MKGLLRSWSEKHKPAFGGGCRKLIVEFTSADGFAQGIEDRRQRRKLAHGNGVLVLGKLDGFTCIAQAEESLPACIYEPPCPQTLEGYRARN